MVDAHRYPELRALLWNRPDCRWLTEEQALAIYESHWRRVAIEHLSAEERAFIDDLARRHGRGVLNV